MSKKASKVETAPSSSSMANPPNPPVRGESNMTEDQLEAISEPRKVVESTVEAPPSETVAEVDDWAMDLINNAQKEVVQEMAVELKKESMKNFDLGSEEADNIVVSYFDVLALTQKMNSLSHDTKGISSLALELMEDQLISAKQEMVDESGIDPVPKSSEEAGHKIEELSPFKPEEKTEGLDSEAVVASGNISKQQSAVIPATVEQSTTKQESIIGKEAEVPAEAAMESQLENEANSEPSQEAPAPPPIEPAASAYNDDFETPQVDNIAPGPDKPLESTASAYTDNFEAPRADDAPSQPPPIESTASAYSDEFEAPRVDDVPSQPPPLESTASAYTNEFEAPRVDDIPSQPPPLESTASAYTNEFEAPRVDESPSQPPPIESTASAYTEDFESPRVDETPAQNPPMESAASGYNGDFEAPATQYEEAAVDALSNPPVESSNSEYGADFEAPVEIQRESVAEQVSNNDYNADFEAPQENYGNDFEEPAKKESDEVQYAESGFDDFEPEPVNEMPPMTIAGTQETEGYYEPVVETPEPVPEHKPAASVTKKTKAAASVATVAKNEKAKEKTVVVPKKQTPVHKDAKITKPIEAKKPSSLPPISSKPAKAKPVQNTPKKNIATPKKVENDFADEDIQPQESTSSTPKSRNYVSLIASLRREIYTLRHEIEVRDSALDSLKSRERELKTFVDLSKKKGEDAVDKNTRILLDRQKKVRVFFPLKSYFLLNSTFFTDVPNTVRKVTTRSSKIQIPTQLSLRLST
jgi:hypothetical protein